MQQAIAEPNLVARGTAFGGEVDKFAPGVLAGLAKRGIVVKPGQGEDSGVHAVMIRENGRVDGGYDPRREGRVTLSHRLGDAGEARPPDPLGKPVGDPARQPRPFVDHRRIELDQARPGDDPRPGIVGRGDPARRNQRQIAAAPPRGTGATDRARATPAAHPTGRPARPRQRDLSVGRDTVVLATISASTSRSIAARAIRSWSPASRSGATFRNTGGPPTIALRLDRGEQLIELAPVLQVAQARRVGRADVDRQIIGDGAHRAHPRDIIGDPVRAVLVRPDIDPDHAERPVAPRQPRQRVALPAYC